jgi:hypothetical protein
MSPFAIVVVIAVGLTLAEAVALVLLPKTKSVRVVAAVPGKAGPIFALVTDVARAKDWVPGCVGAEKLTQRDGPARRQRIRYADGRSSEQQVSTWLADRQYGWKETPPEGPLAENRVVFTLTEREGTTDVEIIGEWTARGLFTKLFANFGQPAVARKVFAEMHGNIRKLL